MGTIAQEITRINGAKAAIKTAIERYGETIPAATLIDGYAPYIDNISGGSWLPSPSTILAIFARRQAGGQGPATIEKIYGRTIVWNQLVQNGDFSGGVLPTGMHISYCNYAISNGVCHLTVNTPDAVAGFEFARASLTPTAGHNFIVSLYVKMYNNKSLQYIRVTGANGQDYPIQYSGQTMGRVYVYIPVRSDAASNASFRFYVNTSGLSAGDDVMDVSNICFHDLTLATLDEITTTALFNALYPLPYYAYDPGSLLPLAPDALVTRGINQWDEVWELGGINTATGNNTARNDAIRSANYIPLLPGVKYYAGGPYASSEAVLLYYDINKTYITYITGSFNMAVTPPTGAAFMRFYIAPETVYGHNVCVNISDASINGQYFPYRYNRAGLPILKHFPDGLKSAGTVYDELTPKKATQRVGTRAYQAGDESDASVITDGTNTNYALATPVETTIDEQTTYLADLGGTEEVTPITAPFSADIRYAKEI